MFKAPESEREEQRWMGWQDIKAHEQCDRPLPGSPRAWSHLQVQAFPRASPAMTSYFSVPSPRVRIKGKPSPRITWRVKCYAGCWVNRLDPADGHEREAQQTEEHTLLLMSPYSFLVWCTYPSHWKKVRSGRKAERNEGGESKEETRKGLERGRKMKTTLPFPTITVCW